MGFLDFLFGSKKGASLDKPQYELLSQLNNRLIDSKFQKRWDDRIGNTNKFLKLFIKRAYIAQAPIEDIISKLYTIPKLKELLQQHNIEAKGKKAVLVDALVKNCPPAELQKLISNDKVYILTPTGEKALRNFEEKQQKAKNAIRDKCIHALLNMPPEKSIAFIYTQYPDYERFGLSSDGQIGNTAPDVDSGTIKEVKLILKIDFSDSNILKEQRKEIAALIALYHVLDKSLYDISAEVQGMLMKPFFCHDLFEFAQNNSTSMTHTLHDSIKNGDIIDEYSLIEVYIHTKLFSVIHSTNLESIMVSKVGGDGLGVEILYADKCSLCNKGNKTLYKWSEVYRIPKLPLHWGCRCSYTLWF